MEILSLRHAEMGSLAVRREWTDWAAPGTSREPISGQQPLLIDAPGLLALADLISSLKIAGDSHQANSSAPRLVLTQGARRAAVR